MSRINSNPMASTRHPAVDTSSPSSQSRTQSSHASRQQPQQQVLKSTRQAMSTVGQPNGSYGSKNEAITQAALAMQGRQTEKVPQTHQGKNACAWCVSKVLRQVGIKLPEGSVQEINVRAQVAALRKMGAVVIPADQAKPGDIVYARGGASNGNQFDRHIGIVVGDKRVLSNDSAATSFTRMTDLKFQDIDPKSKRKADKEYPDGTIILRLP
jgi:cell wall-associated NlpC family hydrolase